MHSRTDDLSASNDVAGALILMLRHAVVAARPKGAVRVLALVALDAVSCKYRNFGNTRSINKA